MSALDMIAYLIAGSNTGPHVSQATEGNVTFVH